MQNRGVLAGFAINGINAWGGIAINVVNYPIKTMG